MKLNIGAGYKRLEGFVSVDRVQLFDKHGAACIDVVCDVECDRLPYPDHSVDEIACYEVLEHLGDGLIFALNEMWRVLKPTGLLRGKVPKEGGPNVFSDPTHKRVITVATFQYFCGQNPAHPWQPERPGEADYGIKPWYCVSLDRYIRFTLRPRKTRNYDQAMEKA